ncbi:MAG: hypothetical protein H2042_10125 [Rhizobiales bacterium]|nr:hypothetical protein [Hyphomicrobiales bacterium]
MLRKLAVTAGVVTILGVAAFFAPQETRQVAQVGIATPGVATLAPAHGA